MSRPILSLLAETSTHIRSAPPGHETPPDLDSTICCTKTALENKSSWPVLTKNELQETFTERGMDKIGPKLAIGRLLLLPVRSLDNICSWVTCPALLERYFELFEATEARDWLASLSESPWTHGQALANSGPDRFFLEGFSFTGFGTIPQHVLNSLGQLVSNKTTRIRLLSNVVVVGNEDFELLLDAGAMPINVRGQFNDAKNRQHIRFEQTVPPDALFYCTLLKNTSAAMKKTLKAAFEEDPFLQIGSQETTGRGWFQAAFCEISP